MSLELPTLTCCGGPAKAAQPRRPRGELDQDETKAIGWITKRPGRSVRLRTPPWSATCSTPWRSTWTARPPPRVLLPAPPGLHGAPRLRGPQETARHQPAEQGQPARGMDRPRQTRRRLGPAGCRQPGTIASMLACCRDRRPPPGPAVHRVLRLHVLRADAPLRGRRTHSGTPAICPRRAGATSSSPTPAPPPGRPTPTTARSTSTAASKAAPRAGPPPEPASQCGRSRSRPSSSRSCAAHIQQFGAAPDGRLFRSEKGNPVQPSTWWRVWRKVRAASLTPSSSRHPC